MRPLLLALSLSACGGAPVPSETAEAEPEAPAGACEPHAEPEHPTYTSSRLRLELVEHDAAAGMVLPPFEFEPVVDEDLPGPIEMELTIYDPAGQTHTQRFTHANTREQCDPHCDPVVGGPPCPPRRCWTDRYRPPAVRIEPGVYAASIPGVYTFVLHRLDDDDRVSVQERLFEGELVDGVACEALPPTLGPFHRVSCRPGVVPTGSSTSFWGLSARYESGECRARAFALPLDDQVRNVFHEGPYGDAPERALPEGTVHALAVGEAEVHAWLAHHHMYVAAAQDGTSGFEPFVRALLGVFPDVRGPVREVPSCEETGSVDERTVPPVPLEELREGGAFFTTHYEGNRPSGARLRFHDQHPLAAAGLRRQEIVQTVDGERILDRRAFERVLERLTRPGNLEIVVSRARVRHPRCIRLHVGETPRPPPPPDVQPPPPPRPRTGRQCERRSDDCWDCADITFPAEVGCTSCEGREICVRQSGAEQCLAPVRVCCLPGTDCNRPPGCDGPASSCAASTPGGRNDRCTFLSDCPAPLPTR